MTAPRYSICICNYNMADTLRRSLKTILEQIDERFEVVVVDDGSRDESVRVLREMEEEYKDSLRVFPLPRDSRRRLGLTRNESVQRARGEYVLLHLDCDDLYGPFLKDFVEAFHQIESAFGRDILLAGKHINMGKRAFLLAHGPYRDLFRGEDRDLWLRLAASESYIPFEHVDFVERIPKTGVKKYWRAIFYNNYDHIRNYFRTGAGMMEFLRYERKKWPEMEAKVALCRLILAVPARIAAFFDTPLPPPPGMESPEIFAACRDRMRGSFEELLNRRGREPDWSRLTSEARKIFGKEPS